MLSAWKYRHERWLRERTAIIEKNQTHHYEPIIDNDDGHDDDYHGHDGQEEKRMVLNENIRPGGRGVYGSL